MWISTFHESTLEEKIHDRFSDLKSNVNVHWGTFRESDLENSKVRRSRFCHWRTTIEIEIEIVRRECDTMHKIPKWDTHTHTRTTSECRAGNRDEGREGKANLSDGGERRMLFFTASPLRGGRTPSAVPFGKSDVDAPSFSSFSRGTSTSIRKRRCVARIRYAYVCCARASSLTIQDSSWTCYAVRTRLADGSSSSWRHARSYRARGDGSSIIATRCASTEKARIHVSV